MELLGLCFTKRFSTRVVKRLPENFITKQGAAVNNWIASHKVGRRGDSPRFVICEREILVVDLVRCILGGRCCFERPSRNGLGAAIECGRKDPGSDRSTGTNRAGTSANR